MRNKIFSKKAVAAIMSASVVLMPITAFAAEQASDNPESGYVEFLSENMVNNFGTVDKNDGSISNNYGFLGWNYAQEWGVENNFGTVDYNEMGVHNNYGEINNNYHNALVFNITGNVLNNNETASVVGGAEYDENGEAERGSGTVTYNNGGRLYAGYNADDQLTVTNFYYGEVLGNYDNPTNDEGDEIGKIHILNDFSEEGVDAIADEKGVADKSFITVDKHYHSVEVKDADNVDVSYTGFVFSDFDEKEYALVAENGEPIQVNSSITIKAKHGYKLSDTGKTSGETDKFSYTLDKHRDGSYTVNITELKGNAEITLKDLHLDVCKKR